MKKTLAAAITSALVIGVASTTFAAANPFSDVPRDHWSFDAVAKLAQEGVIEGYGDNTFRGDAHITRYEMAQMVAKALAKDGVSGDAKSMLDKLSAEYADELNNLGVRVANLEERSDNVKITGLLRLDGESLDIDAPGVDKQDSGNAKLRLNLDAKVNADWHVKGRIEADHNLGTGTSKDVKGVQAYAEGPLFGATAKLGKLPTFDADGLTNGGMIMDTEVTGAEFIFGDQLRTTLTYGRLSGENYGIEDEMNGTNDYAALQFAYLPNDDWKLAAGYHYFKSKNGTYLESLDDKVGVWELGFDYKFTKDLTFGGLYADSDIDSTGISRGSDNDKSYAVQLTYKGAESKVPGSYGVWLAYRNLGAATSYAPTYDGAELGTKGYEIGVDYMLDKNILAKVVYFDGKYLDGNDTDVNKIFGRVEFQF